MGGEDKPNERFSKRMMKMKIRRMAVLVACILFGLFPPSAFAMEGELEEIYTEQYERSGADRLADALPSDTAEQIKEWGLSVEDPDRLSTPDAGAVFQHLMTLAATALSTPLAAGTATLIVLLVCGLFGAVKREDAAHFNGLMEYFGVLCVCSVCLLPLMNSVRLMGEAVSVCGGFMLAFVPVYAGIMIAGGGAASATGSQTLVFGAAQLIGRVADTALVPAAGGLMSLSAVSSLFSDLRLDGLIRAIQRAVNWVLGIGMTLFSALLTLGGAVTSATDSVAMRTTKFMTASFVPVVGGAVSEALSSVLTCVGVLRASVGAYGMIAMALTLLPALVQLLVWKLMLLLTAAVADVFGIDGVSRLLSGVGSVVGILIAVVVSVAVVFLVSIGIMMMAGAKG